MAWGVSFLSCGGGANSVSLFLGGSWIIFPPFLQIFVQEFLGGINLKTLQLYMLFFIIFFLLNRTHDFGVVI